jgi:hypothetical protein
MFHEWLQTYNCLFMNIIYIIRLTPEVVYINSLAQFFFSVVEHLIIGLEETQLWRKTEKHNCQENIKAVSYKISNANEHVNQTNVIAISEVKSNLWWFCNYIVTKHILHKDIQNSGHLPDQWFKVWKLLLHNVIQSNSVITNRFFKPNVSF